MMLCVHSLVSVEVRFAASPHAYGYHDAYRTIKRLICIITPG